MNRLIERFIGRHEKHRTFWQEHRFLFLIIGTILIAIALVGVALYLYDRSGAAQLDLSRQEFKSVSNQVDRSDDVQSFGANGPLNVTVVDEFTEIYDQQAERASAVDAFGGDPLNPDTLLFGATTPTE